MKYSKRVVALKHRVKAKKAKEKAVAAKAAESKPR
jgi:hypothetical protein